MASTLDSGLRTLGYDVRAASMHRAGGGLKSGHAYAPELRDLLNPVGDIRAEAVFDVEGSPTVAFFSNGQPLLSDSHELASIRQRIWNQGLVSILLVFTDDAVVPVPVTPSQLPGEPLKLRDARADGPLSASDIQSGQIRERHEDWFRVEDRVDRKLLTRLRETVVELAQNMSGSSDLARDNAQYLTAQVLFVSYLEHRGIVGDSYRAKHSVASLRTAVSEANRSSVDRLLKRLKKDFNGDFLDREEAVASLWRDLSPDGFAILADFLNATDRSRLQPSFFPYDFRYIPVEMLSGVYESFIGNETKEDLAAYYTPRHLANLVVEQALGDSKDLLRERIYDGACGSGILLTTAFRRLLGYAESIAPNGRLTLSERIALLQRQIFGSDVSEAACRVTAFSLYLSLLERLEPSDIVSLCDDENLKLPKLRGVNLIGGDGQGNFFDAGNPLCKNNEFTLFISNPPWKELAEDDRSVLKAWRGAGQAPAALKQLAAFFAWRAAEIANPGARLCLILPMSLLLKPTSQEFLAKWFSRVKPIRIINFGDLKELLFEDARLSCVVVIAEVRKDVHSSPSPTIEGDETFEYWSPKADVSLAFARLTLHGVDRHTVQTRAIARSNRELVTRMWGDGFDLALWARLRLRGTFSDMTAEGSGKWSTRKGFHRQDRSIHESAWNSTRALWQHPFVRPKHLHDAIVLDLDADTEPFPRIEMPSVPRLSDDVMQCFDGPRILFPDGPSPDHAVRAVFTNQPASFMSSIAVMRGPSGDEDLLRFATVYLRSDLVRYFVVTQLYQVLGDRDRVSLVDISEFPFYSPERHVDPKEGRRIVKAVSSLTKNYESRSELFDRLGYWNEVRDQAEDLVHAYFGLTKREREIVSETVREILPYVRPYGFTEVFESARRRVSAKQTERYATSLAEELREWRDSRGGRGEFKVEVILTSLERAGPFGLVRTSVAKNSPTSSGSVNRSDSAVAAVLKQLGDANVLPSEISENLYFAGDVVIRAGNYVYLAKPQSPRFWLQRQARRDASRIVSVAQGACD